MSEAKKFVLIDPDHMQAFSKLVQQQLNPRDKPLPHNELSRLDRSMLDIINDPSLTSSVKVQRYNQALAEYLSLNDKPSSLKPVNQDDSTKANREDERKDKDVLPAYSLIGIPKPFQTKARNLLQALQNTHKLTINDKSEVSVNGNLIQGSNATDIIHGIVNQKFGGTSLKGLTEVKNFIRSANIPKSLLGKHILLEDAINNELTVSPATSPSPSKKKTTRKRTLSSIKKSYGGKIRKAKPPIWVSY